MSKSIDETIYRRDDGSYTTKREGKVAYECGAVISDEEFAKLGVVEGLPSSETAATTAPVAQATPAAPATRYGMPTQDAHD